MVASKSYSPNAELYRMVAWTQRTSESLFWPGESDSDSESLPIAPNTLSMYASPAAAAVTVRGERWPPASLEEDEDEEDDEEGDDEEDDEEDESVRASVATGGIAAEL